MGSQHSWSCWRFWQPAISTFACGNKVLFCSVDLTDPDAHILRQIYTIGNTGARQCHWPGLWQTLADSACTSTCSSASSGVKCIHMTVPRATLSMSTWTNWAFPSLSAGDSHSACCVNRKPAFRCFCTTVFLLNGFSVQRFIIFSYFYFLGGCTVD